MARQLESEVEVQASPERVWEVLTNFAAYPDWNPFIVRVLEAEPARRLRWLGHLLVPGLFDGEHRFTIEPAGPGRARVTQQETFRGLLAPLLLAFIAGPTLEGFRQMNRALEARPEAPTLPRRRP